MPTRRNSIWVSGKRWQEPKGLSHHLLPLMFWELECHQQIFCLSVNAHIPSWELCDCPFLPPPPPGPAFMLPFSLLDFIQNMKNISCQPSFQMGRYDQKQENQSRTQKMLHLAPSILPTEWKYRVFLQSSSGCLSWKFPRHRKINTETCLVNYCLNWSGELSFSYKNSWM